MQEKDFEARIKIIQEKLGTENSALIGDEIGILISDNSSMNKEFKNKEEEIKKLKEKNEKLIIANGNLIQQVGMGEDPIETKKKEEPKKKEPFDFKSVFDEKGNFKR